MNEQERRNAKKRSDAPPLLDGEKKIEIKFDFESENTKHIKNIKKLKNKEYGALLLAFLLVLLCVSLLWLWSVGDSDGEEEKEVFLEETSGEALWRGAFSSREAFERCRSASVSIFSNGRRSAGFVYSSDGWIATVDCRLSENLNGKIEVLLCDGRRFFVECFRKNQESGIILMKINAESLTSAVCSVDIEPCEGEELFGFCDTTGDGEQSLFSGRIAHTNRSVELPLDGLERRASLLQISVLLTEEGVGAPIFDADGFLLGICCADASSMDGERFMVNYAFSARECLPLLEKMRLGERVEQGDFENFVFNSTKKD